MASRKSARPQRAFVPEDSLADVEPLLVSEFEEYGDAAVDLVILRAGEMDKSLSYRDRLMRAIRWYLRCDTIPHAVMALNKRILAATEKCRREAAAMAAATPSKESVASQQGMIGRAFPMGIEAAHE